MSSPGDERGRRGHHPATGPNAQKAPASANSVHGTAAGLQRALDNADGWWLEGAMLLIAQLAHDGQFLCGCTITDHELIGLPDHPCRLGAVFAQSARLGVIERVGYHQARRASRQGGVHAVWRGATR